jgi:hypothetical protein
MNHKHPFYNISNHPSRTKTGEWIWSNAQIAAAQALGNGEIVDVPAPANVDPNADTPQIIELAREIAAKIPQGATVMCMTDFTLTCALVNTLRERGCNPVFGTSNRNTVEVTLPNGDVEKKAIFSFARFRAAP